MARPNNTPEQRILIFWKRVNKNGSIPVHMPHLGKCWEISGDRNKYGYGIVTWRESGKRLRMVSHKYSWIISIGNVPNGLFVLHKCDNPSCVNPSHLFLGTKMDNTHDMMRKGRMIIGNHKGERHGMHKLTSNQVLEIRERHKLGGVTNRQLAKEYDISPTTIGRIINNRLWKDVKL